MQFENLLRSFSLLIVFAALSLFSCQDDDSSAKISAVLFSINTIESESGRIAEENPAAIIISIANESGEMVYTDESVSITSFGNSYVAEPLLLDIGNYSLVKFLVLNDEKEIIYATPVDGSALASLVDFPLPINFQIQPDEVTALSVEVISTDGVDPEELGYASLSFIIKPTFDILVSVFGIIEEPVSYQFKSSVVAIYDNEELLRTVELGDSINVIKLRSDVDEYKFIFSSEGYVDKTVEITSDSLEYYTVTPLQIILDGSPSSLSLNVSQDALIRYFNGSGDDVNYGDYEFVNMHAWTNGGQIVIHRSLLEFDLSVIPANATITNATLKLYSDVNTTGMFSAGHQQLSGSNECMINRITSPWEEFEVTWSSQPSVSSTNTGIVAASEASFQDYEIDVTQLVQDMKENEESSFGFMIRLTNELHYRRLVFASSDNTNADIHPKLELSLSY